MNKIKIEMLDKLMFHQQQTMLEDKIMLLEAQVLEDNLKLVVKTILLEDQVLEDNLKLEDKTIFNQTIKQQHTFHNNIQVKQQYQMDNHHHNIKW